MDFLFTCLGISTIVLTVGVAGGLILWGVSEILSAVPDDSSLFDTPIWYEKEDDTH